MDNISHYIGVFTLGEKEMNGHIIHNLENGTIVLILRNEVDCLGDRYGNQSYISGKLNTGTIINLYNNRCVKNHTQGFKFQELHYLTDYMIFSDKELPNPMYNKMTCEIENGLNWCGLTHVETDLFESVTFKPQESKFLMWNDAKITFSTCISNDMWSVPRKEISKITEHLTVSIEYDEKKQVKTFIEMRNKIISLISFGIKDNLNIKQQSFSDYDEYTLYGENKRYREYPFISNEPTYYIGKSDFRNYNFTLPQLSDDKDLSAKLEKLVPILNLYLSLFKYNDMPLEMVFLNIIQAIETYHARFHYNDKSKFIKSVEERFGEHRNYEEVCRMLLSHNQVDENCNYIILLSRVNDLLIDKNDGTFCWILSEYPDFAQKVIDTRHYFTHYSEVKKDKSLNGEDLSEGIYLLCVILEYYICRQLGIDTNRKTREKLSSYFQRRHSK